MKDNDPKDLRFEAAAALDDALISANEAANGKTADLVTVVLFSEVPKIVYPLGDPEGAKDSLKSTPLQSGTFIGGGVQSAITELKKAGSGSTLNRTGIIVLTDGFDDPLSGKLGTIKAITSAGNEGIRVSFGFLTSELDQDKLILDAILKTGGIYSTISKPEAQESFIALVLLKGLTGIDDKGNSDNAPLLPGLSTASQLSPTGPNTFTYAAKAGETFNITVKAIDAIALHATLRDVKANTDIASQETSSTGVAFMKYTAASNMDVEVVVTASNKTTGNSSIFSVTLSLAGDRLPVHLKLDYQVFGLGEEWSIYSRGYCGAL
ncbi:hypothetical protein FGG08_004873 [Glutinoglossum americanum]|uniref:VWFA domain-containing protein n=1 Tax=Glutinoglossum americanum TaxID=1670608 RepID=A0A9P8IAJ1_9PEZI|nr:hypothetical protein FGG08_004873 [Glutinoglossum americanum]